MFLAGYLAVYSSLKQMFLAVEYQRYYRAELCLAVFFALHLLQELCHVCLAVMIIAGIACRIYSGFATQSLYLQSRVVSETVVAVVLVDVASLFE